MAKIIPFGNKSSQKAISPERIKQEEMAGIADWVWATLHSVIEQLKRQGVERERALKVVFFLERHFGLSYSETAPDDILQFEFESQAINPHAENDYHAEIEEIIVMAQQDHIARDMAIRIVKVARLWYEINLWSVPKRKKGGE